MVSVPVRLLTSKNSRTVASWVSKLQTHFERRMLQFCARRPSMTDSSRAFLEVSMSSSVSFCRKTNSRIVNINIRLFQIIRVSLIHPCTGILNWQLQRRLQEIACLLNVRGGRKGRRGFDPRTRGIFVFKLEEICLLYCCINSSCMRSERMPHNRLS